MTFQDPEVELILSEGPYKGPWGHSFGIQLEGSDGVPCLSERRKWYIPGIYLQPT